MNKKYDYYIEPCQLCISRNGSTYEECGWCHDSDTHYKTTDGTYPGDWVCIPYGGDGYPFHELPHHTRQYYKGKEYLEWSDGKLPTDVSLKDIQEAQSRNKSMKKLYSTLKENSAGCIFFPKEDVYIKRTNDFVRQYYSIGVDEAINLENGESLPKGQFDQYTLGVTFSDLVQSFMEKAKHVLNELEDDFGNMGDKHIELADLIKKYPDYFYQVVCQEIIAHEHFHLLQTITLNTTYNLYKASSKIAYLKIMAFILYVVQYGGKIDLDSSRKSLLQYVEDIENSDEKEYFYRLVDVYRRNINIIDNFFSYKHGDTLEIVDLMEGSAYSFQKLLNRTIEIPTFTTSKESRYLKANNYFENHGGKNPLIFMIFCHLSLKHGLLDDGDFMEYIPIPQEIFVHLCSFSEDLEKEFNFNSLSPFSRPFAKKLNSKVLYGYGVDLNDEESIFLDGLEITHDQLYTLAEAIKVIKKSIVIVEKYFAKRDVKFKYEDFSASDNRVNAIRDKIKEQYSILDSDLFLLLLIVVPSFGQKFIFKDIEECLDERYEGLLGKTWSSKEEDLIYKVINDIESMLRDPKRVYCCSKHMITGYSEFASCCNEDSLNKSVETLFEVSLAELIL